MISKFSKCIPLMIFTMGCAQAELVSFTADGGILNSTGSFDNIGFTGLGSEAFDATFIINYPSFTDVITFTESSIQTEIVFYDGMFFGLNYAGSGSNWDYYLQSYADSWSMDYVPLGGENGGFESWNGVWDYNSYTVVPVPAAIWLFGSGLIGLAGYARRNKR